MYIYVHVCICICLCVCPYVCMHECIHPYIDIESDISISLSSIRYVLNRTEERRVARCRRELAHAAEVREHCRRLVRILPTVPVQMWVGGEPSSGADVGGG